MLRSLFIILLWAMTGLTGCSTLPDAPKLSALFAERYPELAEIESTSPPSLTFLIDMSTDLDIMRDTKLAKTPVSIYSGGGDSLESIIFLIQDQVDVLLASKDLSDIDAGIIQFRNRPFYEVLQYLAYRFNVNITYDTHRNLITVSKTTDLQIVLPPILDTLSGSIGDSELVIVEAKPDSLKEVVESAAERFDVEILSFSTTTGVMHLRGRPFEMRQFKQLLETEASERLKFVILNLMVLDISIDNSYNREMNLDAMPRLDFLGNDVFGTFKFSLPRLTMSESAGLLDVGKTTASVGLSSGDKFSALFGLLEHWGTLDVVTAPSVMTANGIPVLFNFTEDLGYWLPGELSFDTITENDEDKERVKEGRPTWEELDPIGLKITLRPKIITDRASRKKVVELDINLETSEVSQNVSTSWQRTAEMPATTLTRPLRREKRLISRAMLREDEMLLLSKLNTSSQLFERSGLPATVSWTNLLSEAITGKKDERKAKKSFIIISAVLPKDDK